jgi:beta-glucanase (GH16 family)
MGSGSAMGSGGAMATGGAMAWGGAQGMDGAAGAGGSLNPDGTTDKADLPGGDAPAEVPPDAALDGPADGPSDRRNIDIPLLDGDAGDSANATEADGGATMTLLWSDEFDGPANTGIDTTKWNYVTWDPGQVNNEAQAYTSRLQNVFQDGSGHLVLRALDTPYAGNKYTSGRIESSGHLEFKFGRVEVSAKLPAGIGSFPGIIAMGTTGTWPQCGELALAEQYGQDKSWFYSSANAGTAIGSGSTGNVKYTFPNATTASSDFHVYSLDRYPDHIVFQVDGIEITRTTFATSSPFYTVPEYLVLDLAIGGTMGGLIDTSAFPMDMVVDYVRVYSF